MNFDRLVQKQLRYILYASTRVEQSGSETYSVPSFNFNEKQ